MSDATEPTAAPQPAAPGPAARQIEDKMPRGILVRVLLYVFAGHAFAGFIYLLFTLGANR